MSKTKNLIASIKFRINRGYTYVGTIGVGFLIADSLKKYYPFNLIGVKYLICFGVIGLWILGYLEDKFKYLQAELDHQTSRNPYMNKIKDSIERRK